MEKFRCLPVKEPFCCFTEIITLLPSEIKKFKEAIENFGVLVPSFGGFWSASIVKEAVKGEKYAFVPLTDKVYVYIDLFFVSYKPYKKPISKPFKEFIKRHELDPPYICPFLDEETFKCSIYEERPISCRRYPAIRNAIFDREQCLACSQGKAFCQDCEGSTVEELLSHYKTEKFKRERQEFYKLIRKAFSYSKVLKEAIEVSESMGFIPPPPKTTVVLYHFAHFIYQEFGLSLEKQITNMEKALEFQRGGKPRDEIFQNLRTFYEVKKVKTLGKRLPRDVVEIKVNALPLLT